MIMRRFDIPRSQINSATNAVFMKLRQNALCFAVGMFIVKEIYV